MTDQKNISGHITADDTKETWSRVSKLSHNNKLKANKHVKRRKQSQSPSLDASVYYPNDSVTPKRLSRIRLNGCNSGDSPSEADALQEIIWDPASPPPLWNGKGAGGSIRGVEISDIVSRIAPNNEKPVVKDLVLQWIGDSAVPCTPDLQQPRVRRYSSRRQSHNVEDLMKLAKQFDINMTRQDKERELGVWQANEAKNSEELDKLNKPIPYSSESPGKGPYDGAQAPFPMKSKAVSHEEELHALFDGPTQHLSGRLSPPSANCSQESRPAPASLVAKRPASADSTSVLIRPAEVPKTDFDDDWENDDLLDDSFMLEVTQNPELLVSSPERGVVAEGSAAASRKRGPCSQAGRPPQLPSCSYAGTFSKANAPRMRPEASVKTGAVRRPQKPILDPAETAQPSPCSRDQTLVAVNTGETTGATEGSGSPGAKDSARASKKGRELESDTLWGEGDDDDHLLYQACDDVERLSASQEQETGISKAPSSVDTTNFSSVMANGKTAPPSRAAEQPTRIFARSYSVPGATNALEKKQDLVRTTQVNSSPRSGMRGRYRFTAVKRVSGDTLSTQQPTCWEARSHGSSAGNPVSHHSTFKRHQSDPVALSNKVSVQTAVRCSAAEIERKKQEAIARRRSRLQATENPRTTT